MLGTYRDLSGNAPYPVLIGDPKARHEVVGLGESVTIYSNQTVPIGSSQSFEMYGGDYVWSAIASNFNSGTVSLQVQGPDGNWQTLGSGKTASDTTGGTGFSLGYDTNIRITVSGGAPAGLYVNVKKIA